MNIITIAPTFISIPINLKDMLSNNIIFEEITSRYLPNDKKSNTCYLIYDNWDDYGYKTTYELHYCDLKKEVRKLGIVKIMKKGQSLGNVELPKQSFNDLDENYCSLGQEQSYYEELMTIPEEIRKEILNSIRDCVYDLSIFNKFQNEEAFQKSLLRDLPPINVTRLFKGILEGHAQPSSYHFKYKLNEDDKNELDILVNPFSMLPSNVHVLIGRNGVGKSRLLSGIANTLTESNDEFGLKGSIEFPISNIDLNLPITGEDKFANLITIAFSAFDRFNPIEKVKGSIRYNYVGLKMQDNFNEFKTPQQLKNDFKAALDICVTTNRKKRLQEAFNILNSDPVFSEFELNTLVESSNSVNKIVRVFDNLSSGHKIIILIVTKLVELVDEKSLVLIDEPETHLHPPLLSSFMRVVSDLLIKRNGVALIATHSPVVLQEVPSSCVTIINKINSVLSLDKPEIETFGENVGTLTREVFKLEVTESGFHKLIKDFLKNEDYDEFLENLGDQIGSEGRAIARSIQLMKSNRDDKS